MPGSPIGPSPSTTWRRWPLRAAPAGRSRTRPTTSLLVVGCDEHSGFPLPHRPGLYRRTLPPDPRHLAHPQNLLSGSARPHPLPALSQLGGTAALHAARVGNRPVRQAHLTAADLPGDVCPNAARQTRQPSTPPRSAGKPALNPPIPHLRPAPETSDRLPTSPSPGHRHLPATHRQLLATPPWE